MYGTITVTREQARWVEGVLSGPSADTRETLKAACDALLTTKLSTANLPGPCIETVRKRFQGRLFKSSDLDEAIRDEQGAYSALVRSGYLANRSPSGIQITKDHRDKLQEGMDNMLSHDPNKQLKGFGSLRESWSQIAGHAEEYDAGRLLIEASAHAPRITDKWKALPALNRELRESLKVSDWGEIFNTSMYKQLIAAYDTEDYQKWRGLVSRYSTLTNLQEQRRVRYGGYGLLPTVAEQGTYQPLTSPGNESVTYTPSKRGGTEDLTWEMFLADDLGAVRDIPKRLGLAAIMTLYTEMMAFLSGNPVIYDGFNLFDAVNHGNTADSAPLSAPNLTALINAMRDQTAYGNSAQILGSVNKPYRLWTPNELAGIAFKLTASATDVGAANEAATTPNPIRGLYKNLGHITIDDFTAPADYYATANPMQMPLMEVGFLNGSDQPEMFVQNDPNIGSMLNSDKITYKIRHVHGKVVLDFRGFCRRRG